MLSRLAFILIFTATAVSSCGPSRPSTPPRGPLEGSWLVVEGRFGNAPDTRPQALPGQFIFTRTQYSAVWSPQSGPRAHSSKHYEPTREETLTLCQSIFANSGQYEISGSRVIIRPIIAKLPEFAGGYLTYEFRVVADTLFLEALEEKSAGGVVPPNYDNGREILKLRRVE